MKWMVYLWIVTVCVFAGCSKPAQTNVTLASVCEEGRDSACCFRTGQSWLAGPVPVLSEAIQKEVRLKAFADRWPTDGFRAWHGAFLTRLGGAYAQSGNVIKAVESVDAGLTEFGEARRIFPQSRVLMLTHAITLSHLPVIFRMRKAAQDSLERFRQLPHLSPTEIRLVEEALLRLRTEKE